MADRLSRLAAPRDYVVSADWIFFGAAGASLFVFRKRIPLAERPEGVFAVPWYPWVPGLFVAVAVLIVGSVLWTNPVRSGLGFALLAIGVPAYLFWSRRSTHAPSGDQAPPEPSSPRDPTP